MRHGSEAKQERGSRFTLIKAFSRDTLSQWGRRMDTQMKGNRMGQYRKKPVVVEAFQMTKERRLDNSEWPGWLLRAWQKPVSEPGAFFCSSDECLQGETHTPVFLQTLEGTHRVSWDDWIIRGVKGELYPCKPDIFEATYEPESCDS